jgi:glutathione synthase/RimK-type ligase-like ATP-grasp enzyme
VRAAAPQIVDHFRIPGSQRPFAGIEEVERLVAQAIETDAGFGPAYAARGNLELRRDRGGGARRAYRAAGDLPPPDPQVELALGELAVMAGADEAAAAHFDAAFARRRIFSPAKPRVRHPSVLVLSRPGPWHQNVPLDFVVDDEQATLHRWYLVDGRLDDDMTALPAYDVVFNAIGEADGAHPSLALARRFVATQKKRVINDPARLRGTGRTELAAALRDAPCVVPQTVRVDREVLFALDPSAADIAGIPFPLLLRPVDRHGGRDLTRCGGPADVAPYLARVGASAFDASAFVDYRSPDGWYRKYRVIFVDGEPLPYHLAIAQEWMIHYYRAPMADNQWMRDEEARYLADPAAVFPEWNTALPQVARALGLDYAGIDCTRLPDGALLVFEADAAMLVHGNDPIDVFPYKPAAVARIRAALEALIQDRTKRTT